MTFEQFLSSFKPEDGEGQWRYSEKELEKAFDAGRQSAFEESSDSYYQGYKHGAYKAGSGIALIAQERQRQIEREGWTPEHDDTEHKAGHLAAAASRYATNAAACLGTEPPCLNFGSNWPWSPDWWKPTTPLRDLVKAGALIAAEIDRLQRAFEPVETEKL